MATLIHAGLGVGAIAFFITLTVLLEPWLGRKRGNGPEHSMNHYLSEVETTSRFPFS
jgi:hypothetical protein